MENVKCIIVRVVTGNRRNQADTPTPKGAEVARGAFSIPAQMDITPPGSKMTPKAYTIIRYAERGKPYALLQGGIDPARGRNGAEGKGTG